MIKVANVIEDGRIGGPHLRIINVASILNGSCFQTTVVAPRVSSDEFVKKLTQKNIPYSLLRLHRLTFEKRHLVAFVFLFFSELIALSRFFRKEQFDVIHVSGGSWQWKGVIAGRLAGCRVLWHLNDTKMPRPIQWVFKLLANTCCDGFILAGRRVQEYYLESLGVAKDLSFVIQAPVDCKLFDPEVAIPDRKIFNKNEVTIVTVANVNWIKGLETYISMAARVSKVCENVRFYIVGPIYDSQKVYYKKLLDQVNELGLDNLTFFGASSDVKSVLAAADIYVCSSVAEASPISVWEAMAMGIPVVSTRVGDVPFYISHGENGYLCDVGDSGAMAKSVCDLVRNASLRNEMGERARDVALANFDIERCVENHAEAYRKAMLAIPSRR